MTGTVEAEFFRRAPAAFAGDEFELAVDRADDERLDDAVLADGFDKFVERGFDEGGAGLERAGDDEVDGDFTCFSRPILGCGCVRGAALFADEITESFA